jgi:hypothetical protein
MPDMPASTLNKSSSGVGRKNFDFSSIHLMQNLGP